MNRDDIIRMAREAGGDDWGIFRDFMPEIERFAKLVAAAEHKAILETVDELTGAEQYRNAMFSDGYDYALGHVKEFIEGREKIDGKILAPTKI
jgi:hypothetical protein